MAVLPTSDIQNDMNSTATGNGDCPFHHCAPFMVTDAKEERSCLILWDRKEKPRPTAPFAGHFPGRKDKTAPFRQTAAHEPPSETTRKPSLVGHESKSAHAPPSTLAERIELPSACGCLAEWALKQIDEMMFREQREGQIVSRSTSNFSAISFMREMRGRMFANEWG